MVRKVAGAQFLVTQALFDNAHYFAYLERARAAGITVPIIPGIMPITDLRVMNRIMELDPRTTVPDALRREIERRADNPEAVVELGVAYATLQCEGLLRGAPGALLHPQSLPATSAIVAPRSLAPGRGGRIRGSPAPSPQEAPDGEGARSLGAPPGYAPQSRNTPKPPKRDRPCRSPAPGRGVEAVP